MKCCAVLLLSSFLDVLKYTVFVGTVRSYGNEFTPISFWIGLFQLEVDR